MGPTVVVCRPPFWSPRPLCPPPSVSRWRAEGDLCKRQVQLHLSQLKGLQRLPSPLERTQTPSSACSPLGLILWLDPSPLHLLASQPHSRLCPLGRASCLSLVFLLTSFPDAPLCIQCLPSLQMSVECPLCRGGALTPPKAVSGPLTGLPSTCTFLVLVTVMLRVSIVHRASSAALPATTIARGLLAPIVPPGPGAKQELDKHMVDERIKGREEKKT